MVSDGDMKKLVLVGGGGHCKSVLDVLLQTNEYSEIVITDPYLEINTEVLGCSVVGDDTVLEKLRRDGFEYAFITVGSITDATIRKGLAKQAKMMGFEFPVVIDPSATISQHSRIGPGTFIGKNVVVNVDVTIGEHCIINTSSIIEHECVVGDFTHVSVGSILCGKVKVANNCFIGAGSTVIQCVNIGNNVTIGANSTVLTDVKDDMKCYGIINQKYI